MINTNLQSLNLYPATTPGTQPNAGQIQNRPPLPTVNRNDSAYEEEGDDNRYIGNDDRYIGDDDRYSPKQQPIYVQGICQFHGREPQNVASSSNEVTTPIERSQTSQSSDQEIRLCDQPKVTPEVSDVSSQGTPSDGSLWTPSDDQSMDNIIQKIAPSLGDKDIIMLQHETFPGFLAGCLREKCDEQLNSIANVDLEACSTTLLRETIRDLKQDHIRLLKYSHTVEEFLNSLTGTIENLSNKIDECKSVLKLKDKRLSYQENQEFIHEGIKKALEDQNLVPKSNKCLKLLTEELISCLKKDDSETLYKYLNMISDNINNFSLDEALKADTIQMWQTLAVKKVAETLAPVITNNKSNLQHYVDEKLSFPLVRV